MRFHRAPIIMPLPPPADEAGAKGAAMAFISKVVLAASAVIFAAAAIVAAPGAVLRTLGYVMLLALSIAALTRIAHRLAVPRATRSHGDSPPAQDVDDAPDFGMTG